MLRGLGVGLGELGRPAHRLIQHGCFERVCVRQNAVDILVGGVLLFSRIEKRLGIVDVLASCVTDTRDPASTTHSLADMIRARMFAIACGYEDCDDLDGLRFDPAFKLACGHLAETGAALMSQPTLSRLDRWSPRRQS